MTPITSFNGRHRFLSNFFASKVVLDGMEFPTVEHAYQAAKTEDAAWRQSIQRAMTPGRAKRLGRKAPVRAGWEDCRLAVMLDLLRQKFKAGSWLKRLLSATGDRDIIEGNTWGDTYWGVADGVGENNLGRLLMQVRSEVGDGLDC